MASLNQVYSVSATNEEDVYVLHCNITDLYDLTYDVEYYSRPEDPFGLNPDIRKWLAESEYEVIPYVAPETVEEEEV